MEEYLFLGGDRRIIYAAELMAQSGAVCAEGLCGEFAPPEGRYSRIVLPLPFSRDGMTINAPLSENPLPLSLITEYAAPGALVLSGGTSPELEALCAENGLKLADYFTGEELTLKNAVLTAEGAVSLLISSSDTALFGSSALIIGYGRIGGYLARMLRDMRCRVTVAARSSVQRERALLDGMCTLPADLSELAAAGADFVINTAPAQLLTEECFGRMHPGAVYMELASKPAAPEKLWAEKAGVKHVMASGLPGKFSAKTAGEAVAQAIISAASV